LPLTQPDMATFSIHVVAGALSALLAVGDPFAFLAPQVVLTDADRRQLADGQPVARTLKAGDGEVALLSISRVDVPPETLLAATRRIEDLKRSSLVSGLKRFSNPPRLDDLDELRLSPRDLAVAAACRPGNCSFKLTAAEIDLLRSPIDDLDRDEAIQRAFRRVVLARVNAYLAAGLSGLPPTANRSNAVCLDDVFKQLAAASPSLPQAPCASSWLRDFPNTTNRIESFLYWSQETYGRGKPVVVVTHVGIIPPSAPGDPAIVLGKQVMATRYMTGGLSLMAITTDQTTGINYLVHLNRTGVDLLGGLFGPLKRSALESRLKRELPDIIQKLRARLERTPPAVP
jgi:hypothetical protein